MIEPLIEQARSASLSLLELDERQINEVLLKLADALEANADAIIAANADLEVVKVQAEAALYAGEKEAEMNKRISESLTDGLIQYYWIKQWDGKLPTTVLGESGNYMIDLTE